MTSTPHFPSRRRLPRRIDPRAGSKRAQIIAFVDAHPMGVSGRQIAEAFDLRPDNVPATMRTLHAKGLVARLKDLDGRVTWLPARPIKGRASQ